MKCFVLFSVISAGLAAVAARPADDVKRHNMPGRSDSRPFSHAIEAGETVYIAGTIGIDPETGLAPESVEREIRLMLDGMKAKLELVDLGMDHLVSVQVFCSDLSLYDQFNDIYRTYFSEGKFPVRAFIGSGPILREANFEICGIAYHGP